MGTVEQSLTPEEMTEWMTLTDAPLEPIELDFNFETMSLIGGEDQKCLAGRIHPSGEQLDRCAT